MKPIETLTFRAGQPDIQRRARRAVEHLVKQGHSRDDIARLCDTTVLSLLDGAKPQLSRPQYMALARHYDISLFWLWTGLGSMIIHSGTPDSTRSLSTSSHR